MLLPGRLVLQARSPQSVTFTIGVRLAPPADWQPGDLVAFRTPDLRPYYPAGTSFTKAVAGVPGDRVIRLGRDFYVNGRYADTARATDSYGRPAQLFTPPARHQPLCHQPPVAQRSCREMTAPLVPDAALFVLGSHERSYDGRYWGYVNSTEVLGRVVALL
ncbi:MAG: S26 family signal peptidase [Gemmataceae bacterium]|nr:S26 family signal peptidase [Gemmataceae bacterium]